MEGAWSSCFGSLAAPAACMWPSHTLRAPSLAPSPPEHQVNIP